MSPPGARPLTATENGGPAAAEERSRGHRAGQDVAQRVGDDREVVHPLTPAQGRRRRPGGSAGSRAGAAPPGRLLITGATTRSAGGGAGAATYTSMRPIWTCGGAGRGERAVVTTGVSSSRGGTCGLGPRRWRRRDGSERAAGPAGGQPAGPRGLRSRRPRRAGDGVAAGSTISVPPSDASASRRTGLFSARPGERSSGQPHRCGGARHRRRGRSRRRPGRGARSLAGWRAVGHDPRPVSAGRAGPAAPGGSAGSRCGRSSRARPPGSARGSLATASAPALSPAAAMPAGSAPRRAGGRGARPRRLATSSTSRSEIAARASRTPPLTGVAPRPARRRSAYRRGARRAVRGSRSRATGTPRQQVTSSYDRAAKNRSSACTARGR